MEVKMKNLTTIIAAIILLTSITTAQDYSLSFDGVDDYVSTGPWFSGVNNDYTILVNIRINQSPDENEEYILIHRAHWHDKSIWIDQNTNNLSASDRGGQGIESLVLNYSLDNINLNQWYSVAFTANTDSLKLYIDGVLVDSDAREFGDTNWDSAYIYSALGGGAGYGGDPNVNIDDISIWDTELSVSEIQTYMFTELNGNETELVGYWNFNEGTGTTAYDVTSNSNDGTIYGATWSDDVPPTSGGNNALNFDGDGDYVNMGSSEILSLNDFTISMWFKTSYSAPAGDWIYLLGRGDTYGFFLFGDGTLRFSLEVPSGNWGNVESDEGSGGTITVTTGTWRHSAVTRNSSTGEFKLYIDGSFVADNDDVIMSGGESGSSDLTGQITSNWPFQLSMHNNGWAVYDGNLDEVAIWNDALTSAEITALYNSGSGLIASSNSGNYTSSSNLQAYWNFNEGTGTTLTDQTSNDNDGTITGASWTGNGAPVTEATTATNTHSLSFDGDGDYAVIEDASSYIVNSDASLIGWFKINEFDDTNPLIGFRNYPNDYCSMYAVMGTNGTIETMVYGNLQSFIQDDYSLNQWYHIALIFNGETFKTYLDGELAASVNTPSSIFDCTDTDLFFGGMQVGDFEDLNGGVDDVSLWSLALTQDQIQSHMHTSLSGDESGLVGYWNFNEGSGTTLTDQTSNGNNGTIYGATWSTDVPFSGTTTTSALTWSVQAQASLGSYNDNDNYLGVASDATNTFDAAYDEVEPPAAPGSSISLYFPHSEWDYLLGDNFSTDARPEIALTDTMQVWDFEVVSTDAGEATLTFVFTDVPSVPVILENTATGVRENLSNNETYTFTAVADSAHPFKISIGDTTAPSLALGESCSGPAILNSDSTKTLNWTTTDGFTVDSIEVWFSPDSGSTYNEVASIGGASSYNWTVPDTTILYNGLLKIKSKDYAGNETEKWSNYIFAIVGDSISTTVSSGWSLWSAPMDPANDTMTVNLNDDFTGYWVTYDYVNNGYTYDGILNETEGYWLGTVQNATIDIKGTALTSNKTMSLSQGWDLVSNPLVLEVYVDSLNFTKDETTKSYAEAVIAGWVNSIYGYSDSGYESATTFHPWSGYWIGVLETDVSMTFPIHKKPSSGTRRLRDNGWFIAFSSQAANSTDETLVIGANELATDDFDSEFDAVTPPTPPGPDYVSLFISHPEWNYLLGDNFSKDIRGDIPVNSFHEWIVAIETTEDNVEISWLFNNIPDEFDIGIDTANDGFFDDMRNLSTFILENNQSFVIRVGSGVLGIEAEVLPIEFALHQNFPNPFNPVTTLRYDLPEQANVNIIIYDMLGRQVRTLVNQTQDAGFKSVIWDATNDFGKQVSAGVYIYQIQAGEFVQTRKMVLLK